MTTNTKKLFIELVRTGLWPEAESTDIQNHGFTEPVDWEEVYRLATEQSVLGLVLAGIDWFKVHDSKFIVPQTMLLQWIGEVQILEQQNKEMNGFIAELVKKLRTADINTLLVKGQGVAQCYERPLWRSCGDVDLLLSDDNYVKAKSFLTPLAEHVDLEDKSMKHLGMTIDQWTVELHGSMRTQISSRMNRVIDDVQHDLFYRGKVRSWMNDDTMVSLPGPDNDVILIFTHYLQHFFIGGVGLRQICDWCRLLWTYRGALNHELLEKRIKKMGLMSEWKVFGAFAVEHLGMPYETIPLYDSSVKWKRKAAGLLSFILKVGNMGHNHDYSYRQRYSGLLSFIITFRIRFVDSFERFIIFPLDSSKFFAHYVTNRFVAKLKY